MKVSGSHRPTRSRSSSPSKAAARTCHKSSTRSSRRKLHVKISSSLPETFLPLLQQLLAQQTAIKAHTQKVIYGCFHISCHTLWEKVPGHPEIVYALLAKLHFQRLPTVWEMRKRTAMKVQLHAVFIRVRCAHLPGFYNIRLCYAVCTLLSGATET